jgi:hypothetical protein
VFEDLHLPRSLSRRVLRQECLKVDTVPEVYGGLLHACQPLQDYLTLLHRVKVRGLLVRGRAAVLVLQYLQRALV